MFWSPGPRVLYQKAAYHLYGGVASCPRQFQSCLFPQFCYGCLNTQIYLAKLVGLRILSCLIHINTSQALTQRDHILAITRNVTSLYLARGVKLEVNLFLPLAVLKSIKAHQPKIQTRHPFTLAHNTSPQQNLQTFTSKNVLRLQIIEWIYNC